MVSNSSLNPRNLVDSAGKHVALGALLGQGGEGAVFDAPDAGPDRVIKLYHSPPTFEKQEKLRAMVQAQTQDLLQIATWPTDTVHDARTGQVVGFVMPKLKGYEEIYTLYVPAERKREYPAADWAFLVQAARNIAAAVATFHQMGHVVGDINPNNVVVSRSATIKLIDCDSFQIGANGRHFKCEVGVLHFTPPELRGKSLSKVFRTPNHDCFGVALLCFHLLFMGRHPFAGKYRNGQQDMPIERAIQEFRFAYSIGAAARQMAPPPNTVSLEIVPESMQHMFECAFGRQGVTLRPTAAQWVQELETLLQRLADCPTFVTHKYLRTLPSCPWCALEARSGVSFFTPRLRQRRRTFDLNAVWAQIMGVTDPGPAVQPRLTFNPVPRPIALPSGADHAQLVSLYKQEREHRRAAFAAAVKRWQNVQVAWQQHTADKRFEIKLQELQRRRDEYKKYQQLYQAERDKLHLQAYKLQLHDYLGRHLIRQAKLNGIGQIRAASLASYGIETAADVNGPRILAIPGFGPVLTQELVNWRRQLEKSFVFNPAKQVQTSALMQLEGKYAVHFAPLEKILSEGAAELEQLRQEILVQRQTLLLEINQAARAMAQAKADLRYIEQQLRAARKEFIRYRIAPRVMRSFGAIAATTILAFATYTNGPALLNGTGKWLNRWQVAWVMSQNPRAMLSPVSTPMNDIQSPSAGKLAVGRAIRANLNLNAWLYVAPDPKQRQIRQISQGEAVTVIGRTSSNIWCQVRLDDGQKGWLNCIFLDFEESLSVVPEIE